MIEIILGITCVVFGVLIFYLSLLVRKYIDLVRRYEAHVFKSRILFEYLHRTGLDIPVEVQKVYDKWSYSDLEQMNVPFDKRKDLSDFKEWFTPEELKVIYGEEG